MLTVMHRGPDGTERIFEAESVSRFPPEGEKSVPATGKVWAAGVTLGSVPGDALELDISEPFGAVFVMNRFGSTVARYV